MIARWTITLAVVTVMTAILTACGGGDSTSTSSAGEVASSSSKAAFLKAASAACAGQRQNSFAQIAAYTKRHRSDGLSQTVLVKKATRATLLSIIAAEIDALRKLRAPARDEQAVEAMLAAQQAALDEAKANKRKLVDVEDYFAEADRELRGYGLGKCTKGVGN